MTFRYYPLEVGGLKTCSIRSNWVLRSAISLGCFLCSLFWFSHWTGNQNIPRKQPSMSVVSSINQLRTAPKSVISLPLIRPRWSSKGSKSPLVLHDITQRPRILFDWLKGYRCPQICRTNIAIASTMSVYPTRFPQRIAICLWLFPQSG